MSLASPHPSIRRGPDEGRRKRIIEAAERAFVRHGFHAATMQHVAEEADMSAGNLYRYFPPRKRSSSSSAAIEQESRGQSFAELLASERRHRRGDVHWRPRPRYRQAAGKGAHDHRDLGGGRPQRARRRDDPQSRRRRARDARACDRPRQGHRRRGAEPRFALSRRGSSSPSSPASSSGSRPSPISTAPPRPPWPTGC